MERGKIQLADLPESLDDLLAHNPDRLWCFWDLDQTAAPLLSTLPLSAQKDLYKNGKVVWNKYDIFYEPTKILCICYDGGENVKFYNLCQYFPDYELSMPADIDIAERCVQELSNALQSMGIWTKTLTSPAAIYENYYMGTLDIPTVNDISKFDRSLLEFAINCADKEWTETFKIGHFNKVYEYDISGAYPNIVRNLYDPRDMEVKQSEDYQDSIYGYALCEFEIIDKAMACPIVFVDPSGKQSNPTGFRRDYLTKAEIDFIRRYKIGTVDVIDGWWLSPRVKVQPLEHVLERLLEYKKSSVPLVKFLAKEMSAGIYGKFGQEFRNGVGKYYNPVWFAETSSQCRLKVGEFIYKNKCWPDLIQVRKDSVMTTRPLELSPGWRLSYEGEALVISNDLTFLENRHPKHWTLEEVKTLFTEHPNTAYYEKKLESVVTLEDAHKRKAYKELGLGKHAISSVDLFRVNYTRQFRKMPECGGDVMKRVYESSPLTTDKILKYK